MPDVRLTIGGASWRGWTRVSISRSIEALCSSFDLDLVDEPAAMARLVARPGSRCAIHDGSRLMLTGYVESFTVSRDADTYRLRCSGRSLTADLADSDLLEPIRFVGESADTIARRLASIHGLDVVSEHPAALAGLGRIVAGYGTAQREVLERAARQAGLQVSDTPSGAVRLLRVAEGAADAVGPVLRADVTADAAQLFARVSCRSQTAIADDDTIDAWASMAADVTEPLTGRARTLAIHPEQGLDREGCRRRAVAEVARRAGQAVTASIEVGGWRDWTPGQLVRYSDDAAGLDAVLCVSELTWRYGEDGARTVAVLRPPAAYLAEDPRERRRSPGSGSRYWSDLQRYAAGATVGR